MAGVYTPVNTPRGDLRIGSLFTGYGGLDLAAAVTLAARVVWNCDNDPAATRLLAHHYPDVPNLGDITAVDWSAVEPVDVLTGGFPCQDVSSAGRRAGLKTGTRSGLWSQMVQAIATLRPSLVLVENVRGLLSAPADSDMEPCPWCLGDPENESHLRALGAVLGNLADLGYDAVWCGLRAADIGTPHARFRVFIAAADTRGEAGPLWPGLRAGESTSVGRGRPGHRDGAADALGEFLPLELHHEPEHVDWGPYAPAIELWARIVGRPAPVPLIKRYRGGRFLNPALPEWMMGLPDGWITDVPGLARSEQLKLAGNGVVPQQAAAAVRYLLPLLLSRPTPLEDAA